MKGKGSSKKVISINDPSVAKDFSPISQIVEENGKKVTRVWEKVKFLGSGGFGTVFKVVDKKTQEELAVKVILREPLKGTVLQKLRSEVQIHSDLDNDRIVKMREVFEDVEKKYIYILLDLCNMETLKEVSSRRRRLHEPEIAYWMKEVIEGVIYLHQQKVIHRDLKLANIFIHDMHVKIGDFGLAAQLDSNSTTRKTMCGTPTSMAPEIITKTGHSYAVDIWAIGVMLYYLKFGMTPFGSTSRDHVYDKIKKCEYGFPPTKRISDALVKLIDNSLMKDPTKRPTADQLLQFAFFDPHVVPASLPEDSLMHDIDIRNLVYCGENEDKKVQLPEIESIKRSMKAMITKRPAVNAVVTEGKEYNVIIDYLDKTDKYGVIYLMEDSTVGGRFNDNTTIFFYGDYYSYYGKDLSKLDVAANEIDKQTHDVNKKCRIIKGFLKNLEGGDKTKKDLKMCLVRKYNKEERFSTFIFEDNSMEIFFGKEVAYFVNPYQENLIVIKNRQKYPFELDKSKIRQVDPRCDEHFGLLNLVLDELANKIVVIN
ncbi:serine/threonine protein kinase, putative [Entamoeba invadens IP1]|uniref:Serine/threonine protein kinase, putative n=1 Tax=Entamoeba invadens IP1 TaxID=370355 RepID=A0A0A1U3Z9_ENTIV|nr:serine/threonine protein kinase, putative [Entamoeba invadens IP1]ELP88957.1 serine/threonine protein kinase, putative [Entamoeba invadens IP1]|eukprot:XP_004255728.1 serine/threonine protein kinase, putative [Entamoeba invadens IP1]